LAKLAAAAKLPLVEVEHMAWNEAFFTGKLDQSIPIKVALKIADRLGIRIQESD
jgi:hypothetical protein